MKSTTYIYEKSNQKNEKYLSVGRNPVACLCPCRLASCQLRNFLREFTEKCLLFLTNQAAGFISCGIGHSNFSWNFILSFLLWYDFKILVKSRRGGTFLSVALSVNVCQKYFFQLKAKYLVFNFLGLDVTILNLI